MTPLSQSQPGKRALVVRHAPCEGIAGLRQPIEAAGYSLAEVAVGSSDFAAADFLAPDLLILMGGPMAVYEHDDNPWIAGEIERLTARLARNLPTFGVCLGAQMIAAALGASVYPGAVKEVGFAPLTLTPAGIQSPLHYLADRAILHWHGDTFDLPKGTELLASTPNYAHQAFCRGANLLAVQFHPEMGDDVCFEEWMEDVDYLKEAGTAPASMRADHVRHGPAAVTAGRAMMQAWLAALQVQPSST